MFGKTDSPKLNKVEKSELFAKVNSPKACNAAIATSCPEQDLKIIIHILVTLVSMNI
jgi:hypothetical protein